MPQPHAFAGVPASWPVCVWGSTKTLSGSIDSSTKQQCKHPQVAVADADPDLKQMLLNVMQGPSYVPGRLGRDDPANLGTDPSLVR